MLKRLLILIAGFSLAACGDVGYDNNGEPEVQAASQLSSDETLETEMITNEMDQISEKMDETNEDLSNTVNEEVDVISDIAPICHDAPNCDRPVKRVLRGGHVIYYCKKPTPTPLPCVTDVQSLARTDQVDFRVCPEPGPDPVDPCRIKHLAETDASAALDAFDRDRVKEAIRVCKDDIDRLPPDVKQAFFLRLKKRLLLLDRKLDHFYKIFKQLPERWQAKLKEKVIEWLRKLYQALEFVEQRLNGDVEIQAEIIRIISHIQDKMVRFAKSL